MQHKVIHVLLNFIFVGLTVGLGMGALAETVKRQLGLSKGGEALPYSFILNEVIFVTLH